MHRRLILVAFGLVLATTALLIAEVLVRVAFPWVNLQGTDRRLRTHATSQSSQSSGSAVTSLRWRPGAQGYSQGALIKITELGTRDLGVPSGSDNTWLILGDSVATGVGVAAEQTFAGLLQKHLPARRILNAAVIGAFPSESASIAVELTAKLGEVDRITFVYCLNDIPFPRSERTDPSARHKPGKPAWTAMSLSEPLRENSKLYRFLAGLVGSGGRSITDYDLARYRNIDERADEVFAPLAELASIAKRSRATFDVIVMPYRHQLEDDTVEAWIPQGALGRYLDRKGIAWIDARHWFLREGLRPRDVYLWGDPIHFNAEGHRVIFEQLRASGVPGALSP